MLSSCRWILILNTSRGLLYSRWLQCFENFPLIPLNIFHFSLMYFDSTDPRSADSVSLQLIYNFSVILVPFRISASFSFCAQSWLSCSRSFTPAHHSIPHTKLNLSWDGILYSYAGAASSDFPFLFDQVQHKPADQWPIYNHLAKISS